MPPNIPFPATTVADCPIADIVIQLIHQYMYHNINVSLNVHVQYVVELQQTSFLELLQHALSEGCLIHFIAMNT